MSDAQTIQAVVKIDGVNSLYLYDEEIKMILRQRIEDGLTQGKKTFKEITIELNAPPLTAEQLIKNRQEDEKS